MPTFQDAAAGAKSSKFTGINPFTPFLAQPGDLDTSDDVVGPAHLAESLDDRLRIGQTKKRDEEANQRNYAAAGGGGAGAGAGAGIMDTNNRPQTTSMRNPNNVSITDSARNNNGNGNDNNDGDGDGDDNGSDFDSDFEDDDPTMEAFRQRRLAEMKRAHIQQAENKAKGHGDYRIISQDEFLPECNASGYVTVHFFHRDFERCKIMEYHLKRIAKVHLGCKFVAIDAEKAPFFVAKLNIKTLPTLVIFKDGKTIDRLLGFEDLSETKNADEFTTSSLGRYLEKTGAIEYEGPDSDEEEETPGGRGKSSRGGKTGTPQNRFRLYDEDI